MTEQTSDRWKRAFLGMGMVALRRLRQVEEEIRTRNQLMADLTLDKHMLQEVLRANERSRSRSGRWCASLGRLSGQ